MAAKLIAARFRMEYAMPPVPENLMARLHQANEQFHQARLRANDLEQMDSRERQELAAVLRAAEKEVEDATRAIDAFLAGENKPSPDVPL